MKQRGFLSLKALVRLALAIILLIAAVMIGCEVFEWAIGEDKSAEEHFKERLVPKVIEVAALEKPDFKSVSMTMEEDTFIVFFGNGHEKVYMYSPPESRFLGITTIWSADHYFNRPAKCGDEGCICLCLEYTREKIEGTKEDSNIFCKNSICETVGDFDFQRPAITSVGFYGETYRENYNFEGGAIIQRKFLTLLDAETGKEIEQPQTSAIYIEKGPGNLIGICETREKSCFE
ncbi:MAG: hypothetical protein KAT77_02120 [Nanoarchaeota archaeon]|nr:hypothetical protein [Nanoarchaeota archaeon]